MPATQPEQLVEAIRDAVQESRHSCVLISKVRTHPRQFVVGAPDGSELSMWVYAWTLTPGGRKQLLHEYRVQMTTVTSPMKVNPNGATVLVGYEPNLKMFAGFDLGMHRSFTPGSSSVQIDIRVVEKALQDGLGFDRKNNDEIAVGIRPDQFMTYVYNAGDLHKFGTQMATLSLLMRATSAEAIAEQDIAVLPAQRQRIVRTVSRLSRFAKFQKMVLNAYETRCAVTKIQLRLVDAAHILPVGAPGSLDDVRNGIALSPTYHRAYDNGLIFLDHEFNMRINPAKVDELNRMNLAGGLPSFRASLGRILLPQDQRQWPHLNLIKKANVFRGIEGA